MFSKFFNSTEDNITNFLDTLDYWQKLNLMTTFYLATTNMPYYEAHTKAIAAKDDDLKFELLSAINSPKERDRRTEKSLRASEEVIDKYLAILTNNPKAPN